MTETPNHGYSIPEQGEEDWHSPLNDNFAAFDADIELRAPGVPDDEELDPVPGAKYLDTDTGVVFIGDGEQWSPLFALPRTVNAWGGPTSLVLGDTSNRVEAGSAATISGGESNSVSDDHATVGGGFRNSAEGGGSTIGGGHTTGCLASVEPLPAVSASIPTIPTRQQTLFAVLSRRSAVARTIRLELATRKEEEIL